MKKVLFINLMIFFILSANICLAQDNFDQQRLKELKKSCDFDNWPGRNGKHKVGFVLDKDFLVNKDFLVEKWLRPKEYDTGVSIVNNTIITYCSYYYEKDKKRISIRVRFGFGEIEKVHERLLWTEGVHCSLPLEDIKDILKVKTNIVGDFCLRNLQSHCSFARNNAYVIIYTEGNFNSIKILELAKKIDEKIIKQPVAEAKDFPKFNLPKDKFFIEYDTESSFNIRIDNDDYSVYTTSVEERSGYERKKIADTIKIPISGETLGIHKYLVIVVNKKTLLASKKTYTVIVHEKGKKPEEIQENHSNHKTLKDAKQDNKENTKWNKTESSQNENNITTTEETKIKSKDIKYETTTQSPNETNFIIIFSIVIGVIVVFIFLVVVIRK